MLRLLILLAFSLPLAAQTEAELQPLFDAFAKERAETKGAPEGLATADKLATRAADARKAENFASAGRLIRDARWALPATPSNLPEGVRVLGYNRLRHGDRANSVHYNADGSLMLTSSVDRSVRVWDTATGREVLVYKGHTPANTEEDPKAGISGVPLRVPEAIFLPGGKLVASAGGKEIHIWNLKTGKLEKKLTGADRLVKGIAASDDGKFLVGGSDDKIVRVWNLETGNLTYTSQPQASRIEAVAYQPKGKYVAAVDADGYLAVYDPTSKNLTPLFKIQITDGGTAAAHAVRFTPDGTRLFTAGADRVPRLTPAPGADGSVPPNLAAAAIKLPAHSEDVLATDITADGKYFVSGGRDKAVRVVDALGQIVRMFNADTIVTALAVRPDGKQIAAACDDGAVRVFDFLPTDDHRTAKESTEPIWATAIDVDGMMFAAAGADKTIRIYTLNGKLAHTLEGSKGAVTSLAFLPEGKLVSAGGDKLLRLWDAKAGKPLTEWTGHAAAILALAASPDGKLVVSGSADKIVNGWNPAIGKVTWTWTARSAVTALAVSPKHIVVGTADGGMSVLTVTGDKVTLSGFANAHVSGVAAVVFNKDFTKLASVGGDGVPKIWSVPESGNPGTLLRMTPVNKPASPSLVALSAVAWSPDGAQIAAAGADKIIRIYNATAGGELRALRGCGDWVTSLAYSPDGDRLVAVSAEGAARIFDVTRIDPLSRGGHASSARAISARKDGKLLATVGDDKTIRFWNPATGLETGNLSVGASKLFSASFAGDKHLAAGGNDRRLHIFDLDAKKPLSALAIGEIYGITPNAAGDTLGVWSRAGDSDTYGLYTVLGKKEPVTVVEKARKVSAASFAADLSMVASGDEKGNIIIHDLKTKAPRGKEWAIGKNAVADLGFTPDGKSLIVLTDKGTTIQIADIETRKVSATGQGPDGINGLIISPAGGRFAILGSDGDVRIYDYDGKELKVFNLPSPANGGTFAADGKTFFTANADGSVYVIEVP